MIEIALEGDEVRWPISGWRWSPTGYFIGARSSARWQQDVSNQRHRARAELLKLCLSTLAEQCR